MEPKKGHEELFQAAQEFFEAHKTKHAVQLRDSSSVIQVSFKDLQASSILLADKLLESPEDTLAVLENALEEKNLTFEGHAKYRVRLTEMPETSFIKIREIRARHLDQLIWIEGIVRQASEVRPQVVNARFECPTCGAILSVLQIDKKFREPSRCSCGRKGLFKLLSKAMVDTQRLVIEEAPDALEGGEQPRRMSVFLQEDLVDPKMEERTTPGSRIRAFGILKEVPVPLQTGAISTRFDLAVEANNIIPMEETFDDLKISEEDERQIAELAADPHIFRRLSRSIAPSVYGFDTIKEALLLQLFSGVKKKRSDGGHSRGNIHILLVGDPGVAKSVTLKFVAGLAPKGRYVSGKATTGAGLTAAVIKDEFLKGWSLEAGAMVLSNKGTVCIDELEKMNENDRSTMHEAMEQQTVTISKANIHATLRSETSVLAAGNPKLGRFDPHTPIPQQIDISPALLSRFDVIFVLRDIPNKSQDEAIASHVLEEHKQEIVRDVIEPKLLRKFIAYAQKNNPKLSEEAAEEIKNFYVKLRNQSVRTDSDVKPIPITARQLEAIIRLSEAHSRMRLSGKVTKDDAQSAIALLKSSLMQVGYDEETKTFDIDRIATGITSSKRGKIIAVKDTIHKLESQLGKLIPIDELEKELEGKATRDDIEEAIDQLAKSGDIFRPKHGYIQKI